MSSRERILSDEELTEILDPKRLNLPSLPEVIEIRWEAYFEPGPSPDPFETTTSEGTEVLEIFVIVADGTPKEYLDWTHAEPIERTIKDRLREKGEARWPYIQFGTAAEYSEWKTPVDYEDEAA